MCKRTSLPQPSILSTQSLLRVDKTIFRNHLSTQSLLLADILHFLQLGTKKGPLAHRTHLPRYLVQGKALWRTERIRHGTRYRGRPSGVPNASAMALGTGEGPLAHRTHLPRYLVQGKALWRTERFRHGAWYRKRPFGVPNASVRALGTGKGTLAYRIQLLRAWPCGYYCLITRLYRESQ